MTGPVFWGDPADPGACVELLRQVPRLGIDLIDTADSYGPETSERMIREALHPYPEGLVIATKGGYVRPRPEAWAPVGRPEYLIHAAKLSARRLGVEAIDLWQLHRIDPKVPRDEQFGAIAQLLQEGVIRRAGLSEVSLADIEAARAHFPVASVQNLYNVRNRAAEPVLAYCEANGIAFMPWYPLGQGSVVRGLAVLAQIGAAHGASPSQIALAWLLAHSPVMLPIPGTANLAHLRENVEAAQIQLSEAEMTQLDGAAARPPRAAG
ncbi:MAG TPA: aldo/keto reductase [Caulobacteraceae bacterium]|nr:aldo/keto reductase [Caulobacteraceae bacterium]